MVHNLIKNQKNPSISARQAKILAAIVKEYSNTAEPVGSAEINEKYAFGISPATIRNEMAELEKAGLIEQPHTSAGRVPTDFGYRYFINELMRRFELSIKEQKFLRDRLIKLRAEHQELGRSISKLLAAQTDQAAFALLEDEVSTTGLANILGQGSSQKENIAEVAEFFDNIDSYANSMLSDFIEERPETLIGKEHRLPQIANYSLIVSKVQLPTGEKGIIGIVGPKSMRYDKNITLLEYVAKILSGGALILLIIKI